MNNITKQVITELETIKAIASELADMSPRTQMEIVALCKEICLNVDKVLEKHDIDITTLFNYVNAIESELEEIRQLIDPQHLAMIDERLEDLEASILTINESIGGINETLSTHTTQIQGLQNSKQDVLTAGDNITIENNVISATGGEVSHLYEHNIYAFYDGGTYGKYITRFTFYSQSNTPVDNPTAIGETLYDLGYRTKETGLSCFLSSSVANGTGFTIYNENRQGPYTYVQIAEAGAESRLSASYGLFNGYKYDTIRQIF